MTPSINAWMNVASNPTIEIGTNGLILYDTGRLLSYQRLRMPKENYRFTYTFDGKSICFNDLLKREFRFVGVKSGSRFCLREGKELPKKYPEVQINIPRLEEDEAYIMVMLHEIGHARSYLKLEKILRKASVERSDNSFDEWSGLARYRKKKKARFFPEVRGTLVDRLITTAGFFSKEMGDINFQRFSEQSAWVYAFYKRQELGILNHLEGQIVDYIEFKLRQGYRMKKFDLDRALLPD